MFPVGIKLGQAVLISGSIRGANLALTQPGLHFYPYLDFELACVCWILNWFGLPLLMAFKCYSKMKKIHCALRCFPSIESLKKHYPYPRPKKHTSRTKLYIEIRKDIELLGLTNCVGGMSYM